jgi:hypothetical protein
VSPSRGIPTSRAYWELKAEQMLNRVFTPEAPIEVEIIEPPISGVARQSTTEASDPEWTQTSRKPNAATSQAPQRQRSGHALAALLQRRPELLPISVAAAGLSTALVTVTVASYWNSQQQALRQERNLVLLERLRALGPGGPDPAAAAGSAPGEAAAGDGLPPPPPNEPWMEELAQLPAGSAPTADVLRVPMTPAISKPAPASAGGTSPGFASASGGGGSEGLPQLVGVVQIPGRSGAAIFQIGGTSTNASVGESIGGSGWRLRAASGDTAVIERGGQVRRISISSGF